MTANAPAVPSTRCAPLAGVGSDVGSVVVTASQSQLQLSEPSAIQMPPAPVQPLSLQRSSVHSVE